MHLLASARNAPLLLENAQIQKYQVQKCITLRNHANVSYIFGCMWEVATNNQIDMSAFKFQLSGTSQTITAARKMKASEIKFYVITDSPNKIELLKPDSQATARATCDGQCFTVGRPASFKEEDLNKVANDGKYLIAPYWWVAEVSNGEEANLQVQQTWFEQWGCHLSYMVNKSAVEKGEILACVAKDVSQNKAARK